MEPIYTRELSDHIRRYANLLEAEYLRLSVAMDLLDRDETLSVHRLEDEVKELRQLANRLWDLKESIGGSD